MKALILGSSGQIGSALCNYLRSIGEEVIEFDIVRNEDEDLRDFKGGRLDDELKRADFVYFLAFDVGGARYLKTYQHTQDFLSNNFRIMENTFSRLRKHGNPFIFASSQMSNMVHSPYGILKLVGERYVETLGGLIVKFWNVYGIERDPKKFHVITDFILMALKKGQIDMLTDGNETRQFLYSRDCSACLGEVAQRYASVSRDRSLHITSFEWISIFSVAEMVSKLVGGVPINRSAHVDDIQVGIQNQPDPYVLEFWRPTYNLEQGLSEVITNLRGSLEKAQIF